jgi:hypothetical protein
MPKYLPVQMIDEMVLEVLETRRSQLIPRRPCHPITGSENGIGAHRDPEVMMVPWDPTTT